MTVRRTPVRPCAANPHLFHAPDGERSDSAERDQRIAEAIDLCLDCPLMITCRDTARAQGQTGIWGGETDQERRAAGYRLKAYSTGRRPDCGTENGAAWHRRNESEKPCRACLEAEREANRRRRAAKRTPVAA